jgi:gluconolactonase
MNMPGPPPALYNGGSMQRVDLRSGRFATVYDSCEAQPLDSPDKQVFADPGGFWFTGYGQSDGENRRPGGLFYARASGTKIVRWRSAQSSPSGVGLSPDGGRICMADCRLGTGTRLT